MQAVPKPTRDHCSYYRAKFVGISELLIHLLIAYSAQPAHTNKIITEALCMGASACMYTYIRAKQLTIIITPKLVAGNKS